MAVQLSIPYETLLALIEQLPPNEQHDLLHRLAGQVQHHTLTEKEWQATFQSAMIDRALAGPISLNRADWYDDDGR